MSFPTSRGRVGAPSFSVSKCEDSIRIQFTFLCQSGSGGTHGDALAAHLHPPFLTVTRGGPARPAPPGRESNNLGPADPGLRLLSARRLQKLHSKTRSLVSPIDSPDDLHWGSSFPADMYLR